MSYSYLYPMFLSLTTQCANQETKECKQHKPTWLIFSPVLKHIFILYLIKPQPCPTQRDDCIKMTSQFYQNKLTARCFLSVANYIQQNIIPEISVGNWHFTYYKQRWGHDKTGDFFLIWATQLFWLSHQGNKGFIGGLVTNLLPGQLS